MSGAEAGTHERLGLLAAAGTGILVGVAIVATRVIAHDVGPISLAFLRYAIAVLILLPFALSAGRIRITRADLAMVLLLGIGQFGILIALLNFGLRYVTASRGALLFATFPLMTMIVARIVGREALSPAKSLGVAVSFIGVAIVLGEGAWAGPLPREAWLGTFAVLGSALCGAVCSVFYRPYLERYPTLPIGTLAMAAAAVVLACMAVPEGILTAAPTLDLPGWSLVLLIALTSSVGFLLWLFALKHTTPTKVTAFMALSPITAALLGAALLREPLDPGTLAGTAAVAAGLCIATLPSAVRRPITTRR